MTDRIIGALAAGLLTASLVGAQQASTKVPRAPDGHPDLSGGWTYAIDVAPVALKKVIDGKVTTTLVEQNARHKVFENVPGSLPWTQAPSYKPEFREKVKDLAAHESKVDGVFYCGRPGVPRIGSPRRIIQLSGEFVFLYEEISGNTFRIVPTDGRKPRADANPSYYGDAVGRWAGDTLVVETTNFVEETCFGEAGYFSLGCDARDRAAVAGRREPRVPGHGRRSEGAREALDQFHACHHAVHRRARRGADRREDDGHRLLNLDHHLQR